MAEKHYAFIKNNRVENTLVFAEKDDDLAKRIKDEQGYDSFIWLDETDVPVRWSSYDAKTKKFTEPDLDYLYEIGVSSVNIAMQAELVAAAEAALKEQATTE